MLGKRPSFIKNDKLPGVIDNNDVSSLMDKKRTPEYATFDEWKERGYSVMKGEKSYQKQNGVSLFHKNQVRKSRERCYTEEDEDWFYNEDEDWFFDHY